MHGRIGALHHSLHVLGVGREQADAGARTDEEFLPRHRDGLRQNTQKFLRDRGNPRDVFDLFQDDEEIVSPQPRHRIGVAHPML